MCVGSMIQRSGGSAAAAQLNLPLWDASAVCMPVFWCLHSHLLHMGCAWLFLYGYQLWIVIENYVSVFRLHLMQECNYSTHPNRGTFGLNCLCFSNKQCFPQIKLGEGFPQTTGPTLKSLWWTLLIKIEQLQMISCSNIHKLLCFSI